MGFGKGSEGAHVEELQKRLKKWIKDEEPEGLIGLTVDGKFGQNTVVALAEWQKSHGHSPSGYADNDCLKELGCQVTDAGGGMEQMECTEESE